VSEPARILFVCTGNVCRSVIAAALARRALGVDFEVAGAGIAARPGQPADPYALAALATLGALGDLDRPGVGEESGGKGPPTGSRRLTRDLLVHSELILTATAAHRDAAVALLPAASRRTFTLAEFARLAADRLAAARLVDDRPVVARRAGAELVATRPTATELVAARAADGPASFDGVERLRDVVADVARRRGQGAYVDPASEDITDPRRRTAPVLDCARHIARLVEDCASVLRTHDQPASATRQSG